VRQCLARNRRTVSWVAVVLVAVGAFVFIFFVLPPLVVENGTTRDENGVRSAGSQFLAALVLAAGLYFTGRTLQVNREGQITDRFSKAIEQLGDDDLDVRLGGIYSLERIARDSPRDHGPIMEVLSAYVRRYKRTGRDPAGRAPYDVQAIMTVLGRRQAANDVTALDLRGADLSFVELADANFAHVNLAVAILSNAKLYNVDLSSADMDAVLLRGVVFDRQTKWPARIDPDAMGAQALPF
jgi:Pentapeptide repeats (8 copies)